MTTDLDVHLPAIAAADPRAFGAWLGPAEPSLRQGLRSFAEVVDVEAVLQEALLRTWQVAPRLEPDGRPNALLRLAQRIATHLAISETRRTRRGTPVDPAVLAARADPALVVEPGLPDPLLRAQIERCREKLPERPRQALSERLAAEGGAPDATLAERLGMTKNTFLQNITRARKLLADCLRAAGIDLRAELG